MFTNESINSFLKLVECWDYLVKEYNNNIIPCMKKLLENLVNDINKFEVTQFELMNLIYSVHKII